jgi:hypothetical protein
MSFADWFARNIGGLDSTGPSQMHICNVAKVARLVSQSPQASPVNQAPSRDEFEAWRDDPVTAFVMSALLHNANECREEWLRVSWDGGAADQRKLDGLRERSDALLGFTADYEAFCQTLGLEPEQEEQAA